MGTFLNDTFTDNDGTDLTLHVGELGAAWNKPNANSTTLGSGSAVIASNRLRSNSTAATCYLASAVPADRAQTLTAIFRCVTTAGNSPWIGFRLSIPGTNGYRFGYDVAAGHWKLQYNNVGGGWTTYGIDITQSLTNGQDYTVVFDINNNGAGNDTITVTIDGGAPSTAAVSITNGTGHVGVMFDATATASTDSTGIHIASLVGAQSAASPSFATTWGFVMIGDSLSGDYGLPSSVTIPQLLSGATRLNTDRFWNTAWPGQTLSDQAGLYSTQIAPLYPKTSGTTRRVGIVYSGTNDISGSANATTVINRIKAIHANLRATGYATVAVTIPPSGGFDSTMEAQRVAINANIVADHTWADYFSNLDQNPDLSNTNSATYYQNDHIHYTVAGRTSVANWISANIAVTNTFSVISLTAGTLIFA